MKPFVKVGHRNGHVFLRIVQNALKSTMIRLTPEEAANIADELKNASWRASGKPETMRMPTGFEIEDLCDADD